MSYDIEKDLMILDVNTLEKQKELRYKELEIRGIPEPERSRAVEAEFTDVKIDSWVDKIGGFIELNKLFRFRADAAGEMLGIQNLESKIDTEKEPLGESNSMTDNDGNKLTMTKGSPKPKKST